MVFLGQWGPGVLVGGQGGSVSRAWCSDELGARVVREIAGEGAGRSRRWLLISGLPAQRSGELGGQVPQGSFHRPGVRRISAASRLRPGGLRAELRNARSGGASCLKKAVGYGYGWN